MMVRLILTDLVSSFQTQEYFEFMQIDSFLSQNLFLLLPAIK